MRGLTTALRGILFEHALVHVAAIISTTARLCFVLALLTARVLLAATIVPPRIALRLSLPLFLGLGAQFIEQWRGGRWCWWHAGRALGHVLLWRRSLNKCNVIGLGADRVEQRVARSSGSEFNALIGCPFELRFVFNALAVHKCVAVVHLVELVQRIERDKVEVGTRGYFTRKTAVY